MLSRDVKKVLEDYLYWKFRNYKGSIDYSAEKAKIKRYVDDLDEKTLKGEDKDLSFNQKMGILTKKNTNSNEL